MVMRYNARDTPLSERMKRDLFVDSLPNKAKKRVKDKLYLVNKEAARFTLATRLFHEPCLLLLDNHTPHWRIPIRMISFTLRKSSIQPGGPKCTWKTLRLSKSYVLCRKKRTNPIIVKK